MKRYVLGFAFDDLGRVALLEKQRPAWQAGQWNGIGGKVEGMERAVEAMQREFYEEAGVLTTLEQWRHVATMRGKVGFHVEVFTTCAPNIRIVRSMTDERVTLVRPDVAVSQWKLIDNLPLFFELCKLRPGPPSWSTPFVQLDYPLSATPDLAAVAMKDC